MFAVISIAASRSRASLPTSEELYAANAVISVAVARVDSPLVKGASTDPRSKSVCTCWT